MRHRFTPDNQTNQKLFISSKQFVKSYHFNPIHVATKRELVGLLQQSIVFRVDLVYIDKFCSSKRREIIIFALNYFKKHKQTKHLIILSFNQVYFPFH